MSVIPSRPSSIGRAGGVSATGTMRSNKSETLRRDQLHVNGQTRIQTLFNEGSRGNSPNPQEARVNGVIRGEVHVERPPSIYDERPVDIQNLEIPHKHDVLTNEANFRRASPQTNSNSTLSIQSSFAQRHDVARSSSGKSKKDINELIRKKNLPPIFVNQGFEKSPTVEEEAVKTVSRNVPANISGNSLHFYMSSDYHPDYLTESLPRHKFNQVPSTESEAGETYTNDDIEEVLDDDSVTDIQIVKARAAYVYNNENNGNLLSTFKKADNQSSEQKPVGKGVYSTFDDLSQMYLRDENEIEFNDNAIPLDDINDGFKSIENTVPYGSNVNTTSYGARSSHFSSFKPSSNVNEMRTLGAQKETEINVRTNPFAKRRDFQFESTSFGTTFKRNDSGRTILFDKSLPRMDYPQMPHVKQMSQDMDVSVDNKNPKFTMFNVSPMFDYRLSDKFGDSDTDTKISFGDSTGFSVSGIDNNSIKTEQSEDNLVQKPNNSIDDENASSGSNSSVTVSPYKGETRRRPWMDDFDLQNEDNSEIREPLVHDSDTDTLKDSHESSELRFGYTFDPRYAASTHSELSTPVSSIFDEDTDRGFEEALEQHINPGANVYGGVGLCFESIKEEPEDLTSSGSNPFLDNISNGDEEFRTQAVVSRNSNSRTSSSTSLNDSQLTNSPGRSKIQVNFNVNRPTGVMYKAPIIITTDAEAEFGDSGFTSGLEKGNMSDSSSHQEFTPRGRSSPWPDEEKENLDLSFETNFCDNDNDGTNSEEPEVAKGTRNDNFKTDDYKKPVHRAVENVRSENRPHPVRVKSLERSSPASTRKLPKRGHSFDVPRMDVKPAFF